MYHGAYAPLRGVTVSEAYASALDLSFGVRIGLLMRQIHHWAALVFVWSIVAHLCRIFFTGAFRRPRELNWMVGVTLLLLALLNDFLGYSLLDDLLSGTGLRIGYGIVESIPVVGTWIAYLGFQGPWPGHATIGRMYIAHVLIVPLVIFALLGAHLGMLWRQKHTQFPGKGRTDTTVVGSRLWPVYTAKSLGLFAIVGGVLAALGAWVQINPVWLYGPYEPASVTTYAQPDFTLGWIEGAMRLFPGWDITHRSHATASLPGSGRRSSSRRSPSCCSTAGRSSTSASPVTGPSTTSSTARATGPDGPRSGSASSRSSACCSSPGHRTSSRRS